MAVLTVFRLPLAAAVVGVVTLATPTQVQIVAGSITVDYFGSGITYSGTSVTGGTITRTTYTDSANGGLQYEITGLNHAASMIAALNNAGNGEGLTEFLLGGNDEITGSAQSDALRGWAGADSIVAGAGADTLHGAFDQAVDTLRGGAGNDVYVVGGSNPDLVIEAANEGIDLVQADGDFTLPDQVENLTLTGLAALRATGNGQANLVTGNNQDNTLEGGGGNDTLVGNEGDDTLSGEAGNDALLGGAGNDSLDGGDGNDNLQGGEGTDTLAGGAGNDVYVPDGPADLLVELADGGNDTAQSAVSIVLPDHVEVLVLTGSAAINGTGNAQANRITGTAGANVLDGGAGADTLEGGAGGDSYHVDHAGDTIVETGTSGTDAIFSAITWSLAGNGTVEHLTLTGSAATNGTGNALANLITGNDGANVLTAVGTLDSLFGGLGNDTLAGTANADVLDGGAGDDRMTGGLGNDTYTVESLLDLVIEVASTAAAELNDTVNSWISLTLPAEVEHLTLLGTEPISATGGGRGSLRGNSAGNLLAGGVSMSGLGGNDTLDSAGTAGSMFGGAGNDTYFVDVAGVAVQEDASGGTDTYINEINLVDVALPAQVENLSLVAGANGVGNGLDNLIVGNGAANILDGAGGADTLQGGLGNDVYRVDNAADVVLELAGQGTDRIELTAALDYSLAGIEVENLTLFGTGTRATGNALANLLRGSTGNNTLDGGAGIDTMEGGLGNDSYVVDHAADSMVEAANEGTDTVRSLLASTTLGATLENLVLMEGAVNGTGNAAANVLTGNALANTLYGEAFGDTLRGMEGDDTFTGGSGNDHLDGDAGVDTAIFAGLRQAYTVNPGDGAVTVTGPDGTDVLTGVERLSFDDQVVELANIGEADGVVVVTGPERVGQNLRSTIVGITDPDGTGRLSLQWFRDEAPLAGATGGNYTPVEDDAGHVIRLRVRFVDGAGHTETLWSDATEPIAQADTTAPTVIAFLPADGATNVGLNSNLVLTFSESVVRGSLGFIILRDAGGTALEGYDALSPRVSVVGNTVTVDPSLTFAQRAGYRLDFPAGSIKDVWGNSYAGTQSYNFTTEDIADPVVSTFRPVRGYDSFEVDGDIVLTFSEPIVRGAGEIALRTAQGAIVESWSIASAAGITVSGSNLRINPSADLAPDQGYTLEIPAGAVFDLAGRSAAAITGYAFTTERAGQSFSGTAGNDSLAGTPANDSLTGSGGNDTLAGQGGNDTVSGGEGFDTVLFAGPRSGYLLSRTSGGLGTSYTVADTAASRDGADTVDSAEVLRFSDRFVDLAMGAKAQAIAAADLKTLEELYVGFFARVPEAAGLAYWIDQMASKGLGLTQVADQFYDAGVFFGVYQAGMSNQAFIQAIYTNVLSRPPLGATAPTASEIEFWNQRLLSGADSKGSMVLTMLNHVHAFFQDDPTWGFVADALDNKATVAHYYAVQQGLSLNVLADNVTFGIALAALITPTDTAAAIAFIGVDSFSLL